MLLCTSILDQVSTEAAAELAGDEQAAGILVALARSNAFIQPAGSGWYRYHTLFAEVLRLKLRHEYPDRVAALHRRAARWYARNDLLADAVRHAARAGDWRLAAGLVIDDLAIGQVLAPRGEVLGRGPLRGPGRRIIPAPRVPSVRLPVLSVQLARAQFGSRPLVMRRSSVRFR